MEPNAGSLPAVPPVPPVRPLPPLVRPPRWLPSPPARRIPVWKYPVQAALAIATVVLISTVITRVLPLIIGRPARSAPLSTLTLLRQFGLLVLLMAPVVLVHELGHAAAGTLAGWRLQSLFVGPWRFVRDRRPWIVWHRLLFYYGGAAVVAPREWGSDDRIRRAFRQMVAGGPLASVLLGIVLFALSSRFYVVVAGTMSLAIGIGSLIPIRQNRTVRNDGLQLALTRPRNHKGGARPLDPRIRLGALALMLTEHRPRDWSTETVATLATSPVDFRQTFEYYRALDLDDVARARDILQAAIDRVADAPDLVGSRARQEIAAEAATFEAAWRGDLDAAREWFAIGERARRWDPHLVWIARAAIHAAAGEQPEARRALGDAERSALRRMVTRVDLLRVPLIARVKVLTG